MAISAKGISATAALTHFTLVLPSLLGFSGCSLIPTSTKSTLFFYKPVYNAVTDSANGRPQAGEQKPAHSWQVITLPFYPWENCYAEKKYCPPGNTINSCHSIAPYYSRFLLAWTIVYRYRHLPWICSSGNTCIDIVNPRHGSWNK